MIKNIINNSKHWYIYFAILVPIFTFSAYSIATYTKYSYLALIGEFFIPIVFSLYLANFDKFRLNLLKFAFIFTIIFINIIFLGPLAKVTAPILALVLMWIIKITKEESKWVFGTIFIYVFSAVPSLILMLSVGFSMLYMVLGYILKGLVFGIVMNMIYNKYKIEHKNSI